MPATWTTVRVFISSTFRDMQAERDHLVKVVFPALRDRMAPHRVHLVDVDLRWGVTSEDAENAGAIAVCLNEIDGCRPFFIGLLGERYGWVAPALPSRVLERYPWLSGFGDRSVTELEMLHGVLRDPAARRRALFCLRDPASLEPIPSAERNSYGEPDRHRAERLAELKNQIRASGLAVLDGYPARWNAGRLTGLEAFGEYVHDHLLSMIGAELELPNLGDPSLLPALDPIQEERDLQDRFMESRLRTYVGREPLHAELVAYVNRRDGAPAVVEGEPGCGKSAALARLVAALRAERPEIAVVSHFAGASARETSLANVFDRLCREFLSGVLEPVRQARIAAVESSDVLGLQRAEIENTFHVPAELEGLAATLGRFLRLVPRDTPLVVVMDLGDSAGPAPLVRLWLPDPLPPHVRLLITASWRVCDVIKSRPHTLVTVPPLTINERRSIIEFIPSLSAKRLDDAQIALLLKKPSTSAPLYLQVALEELRGFGSYEHLNERIRALPGGDRPSLLSRTLAKLHVKDDVETRDPTLELFEQVLDRLEREFDASFVRLALGLLYAGNPSEAELRDLTAHHPAKADLFPLLRQLRPYLVDRAGRIGFQFDAFATAVGLRYLFGDLRDHDAFHRTLAEYLEQQPFRLADGQPNVRKVRALVNHCAGAKDHARRLATLADISYVEAKIDAGLAADLANEYDSAAPEFPEPIRALLHGVATDLKRSSDWLRRFPASGFQTLWNAGGAGAASGLIAPWRESPARLHERCWIRMVRSDPDGHDEFTVIHGKRVAAVAVSQNGKLFATAGGDVVRIWWTETCEPRDQIYSTAPVLTVDLFGPSPWLAEIDQTEQGRLFAESLGLKDEIDRVAYAAGRVMHVTRVGSGEELARFAHHPIDVEAMRLPGQALRRNADLPDEQPWEADAMTETWTNNGTPRIAFRVHGPLLIASSWDDGVSIWHAQTGALEREIPAISRVEDLRWTAGGALVVSGSNLSADSETSVQSVMTVDVTTGEATFRADSYERLIPPRVPGHTLMIYADNQRSVAAYDANGAFVCDHKIPIDLDVMAVSQNGGLIASFTHDTRRRAGTWPKTLQVWNTLTAERIASYAVGARNVTAIAFLPDDRLLAAFDDGTARVMDAAALAVKRDDHADAITCLAMSPDGTIVVTGAKDATVRLWSANEGSLLKIFEHEGVINSLAFSPVGDRLAIVCRSQCLIRQLSDGAIVTTITLTEEPPYGAAVSYAPDGGRVAISAHTERGYRVSVFDAATGASVWTSETVEADDQNHQEPSIAYSRDGRQLASGGRWCKTLRVWDAATGVELRSYVITLEMAVGADEISWSGDDSHLATFCQVMTTTTIRDGVSLQEKDAYRLQMDLRSVWASGNGYLFGQRAMEDYSLAIAIDGGGIVAHFPKRFRLIAAHPDQRTFAAAAGPSFYLLRVEK